MHSPIEVVIQRIGAAQHGVVERRQLEQAGIPAHRIENRLKRGRLHRLHQGVYRTGSAPAQLEREMAAVLACGNGAVLSHRSAAVLWNVAAPDDAVPVDVSIGHSGRRPDAGIRVHRITGLRPDELTHLHRIPITTAARTLLDLATLVEPDELERAVARACRSRVATHEQIDQLVARHRRRPGIRALRLLLAREQEPLLTRSAAERLALALFRKAGLERYEVDFLWRRQRVIVEVDGFAFHSSPAEFEGDRRRDAVLAAAGYRVVRVTWRQLTREREAVIARVAAALAVNWRHNP